MPSQVSIQCTNVNLYPSNLVSLIPLPFPPSSSPSNKPVNSENMNVNELVMGTASDISIGGCMSQATHPQQTTAYSHGVHIPD